MTFGHSRPGSSNGPWSTTGRPCCFSWLFGELARVVLDPTVRDAQLRQAIYRRIPAERLQKVVEESTRVVRPDEDSGFDFLRRRYGHLRQFIPAFLAAFPFRSHIDPDPLLEAIDLLGRLGEHQGRHLPRRTDVDFVPPKRRPYVIDSQGRIDLMSGCPRWS
jgi:hypothetical protein